MRHAGQALLLLLASGCATLDDGPADPATRLDWLVRGYEEIALWDDGATATPPRNGPSPCACASPASTAAASGRWRRPNSG